MNILLTADLHLTDNPIEDYRWKIFDTLRIKALENKAQLIAILGDTLDRKDRHKGELVNRFIASLLQLSSETKADILIIAGNHDAPMKGVYFWEFLNEMYSHIHYISKPKLFKDIYVLPFSANPTEEWKDLELSTCNAIFMHQPIDGALIDGERELTLAPPFPVLPDLPIFSGDIHHHQTLKVNSNLVTYIGVPHPVHYNETWKNRIILIKNDDYKNYHEIWLDGTKRAIVELSSSSELKKLNFKEGDQIRIRFNLTGDNLTDWPSEEEKIRAWAEKKKVYLASVEATITGAGVKAESTGEKAQLEIMSHEEVIKKFCTDEKLSDEIRDVGIQLLKESLCI